MDLKAHIRGVPDFPKKGIYFYDVASLLRDGAAFVETTRRFVEAVKPHQPQALAVIESRGFLFGAPVAAALGIGLVLVRKRGKLPGDVVGHAYDLEYGTDTLEVQRDAVAPGQRVVLVDDVLATGGTAQASIELLHKVGAKVTGAAFLIELRFLKGHGRLHVPVESLLTYDE